MALTRKTEYLCPRQLSGDEIRLLQVELALTGRIKCRLVIKTLDEAMAKYSALSYVWGEQSNKTTITCDNQPLRVTQNLNQALLQYRKKGWSQLLWVDAICINQSDLEEKTAQVKRMKKIYQGAALVVIWLGPELKSDRAGYKLICKA
ncbi:MAG: hypothetical protein Q9219_002641 [cf. Caloplaca sp. 3 TL-2023]